MTARSPRSHPAPRTRKEWAAAAERVEFINVAGKFKTDADGGVTAMMLTIGPKFYVRRVYERLAKEKGFIVTSVRRSPPPLVNPLTGELNHVYAVRLERRQ
jgi:hypothetical protein